MNISSLASRGNLQLAWSRVTSGLNISYKDPYRPIVEAYELASDLCLADLRARLMAGTYAPHAPFRYYLPKASGLQRPISHLVLEDLVVLHAMANLFARQVFDVRKSIEGRYVFSNYLNPPDSPFAVRQWWIGHAEMLGRLDRLYRSGHSWVVKFDLSSFYDTISHDLLLRVIAPRGGSGELVEKAGQWLRCWTSPKSGSSYSHGIPQGPVASDVLAEAFLLGIDIAMSRRYKYTRYVDDIRVFGRSEAEIRQAMVLLDELCRERGLIPHVDKLGIVRLRNLKGLQEIAPRVDLYHRPPRLQRLPEEKVWKNLGKAMDPKRKVVEEKTLFRFTLFRAPRSSRVLRLVLRMWRNAPEHTDVFATYLDQYATSRLIPATASEIVRSNYPYDAVKGAQWLLLAKLASARRMRALVGRATRDVRSLVTGTATRRGAFAFLCAAQARGMGRHMYLMSWLRHPLMQAFSARFIPEPIGPVEGVVRQLLERSTPDPSLALTRLLAAGTADPQQILGRGRALNPVAQLVFESAGIIPETRRRRRDRIGLILSRRFGVADWPKWRRLLGPEYAHASSLLAMAERYYEGHYTPWLAHVDSLNEAVFRALQRHLAVRGNAGTIATARQNGELIDYGGLIRGNAFEREFPDLSSLLVVVHERRNRLPSSHPYARRGGRAIPLARTERGYYVGRMSRAYAEFISISDQIGV